MPKKCVSDQYFSIRRREASVGLIMLSTKQGSHWYHFLSLWYGAVGIRTHDLPIPKRMLYHKATGIGVKMPPLEHAGTVPDFSTSLKMSRNMAPPSTFSCSEHNPNSSDDFPVFNFLIHRATFSLMNSTVLVSFLRVFKDHGQSPIHSAQSLKACISDSV